MSDEEITGILLTVLFAGQHTSAVLATWIGLELLRATSCLAQVRDEMQDVYRAEGVMSLASLKQQVTLEHVVRECERLHPPLILLIRKALKPLYYGDYVVPAGALAMVSPAVSHRLPHLFADPERFAPERFAPPAERTQATPLRPDRFWRRQTPLHGGTFCLPAVESDLDRMLDRFDFHLDTGVPRPQLW